jgi:hypothetical protein
MKQLFDFGSRNCFFNSFLQSILLAFACTRALVFALGGVELVADGEFHLSRVVAVVLPEGMVTIVQPDVLL